MNVWELVEQQVVEWVVEEAWKALFLKLDGQEVVEEVDVESHKVRDVEEWMVVEHLVPERKQNTREWDDDVESVEWLLVEVLMM